ncbi:MAG: AAA family ATPase [Deltaproteobacteria bacterium]|nr:AAA family ATPase [Deltaproteobacteria bacterium]
MATTTSKKEILDYLWEWAETTGDWAKFLVKTIIEKEEPLLEDELNAVYSEFLKSILPNEDETPVSIERPELTFEPSDLLLRSMYDIKGVNKLAENQTLDFSKNITVVYGENASGKSGYSRILKALGQSYEKETKVLCNVYCNEETSQNAKIDYVLHGKNDKFDWDGACASSDLQNISVFTNNCVNISLDSKRELLVTPIGFHLFSLVSNELDNLAAIHKDKINHFKKEIEWLEDLHEGTEIHAFLKELDADSSKEDLEKVGSYSGKEEEALNNLQKNKQGLNKELLQIQITSFQNQIRELEDIESKIETSRDVFSSSDWKDMGDHLATIDELKKKEQKGLKEIAEERGIEFYESEEFATFIKAADEYIKKLGKEDYPRDEEEICIYCRQKLAGKDARELLTSYRLLLRDPTQARIKEHTRLFSALHSKLKSIDTELVLHHPSFGKNGKGEPIQPTFLKKFSQDMKGFLDIAETQVKKQIQKKNYDINYDEISNFLEQKIKSIDKILEAKKETLVKIKEKESELDQQINELLDRKKLNQKYSEVDEIITGLEIANMLESVSKSFNTDPISRKTSEARKNLIAENFGDIFETEIKGLRRSDIKVNLNFRTDKAKSFLIQDIASDYPLPDVLSEGEQKAIALAEFLTELQLDKSKAPVVFDDPVTSLDHKIVDEVARRLVDLSNERQVIVFTHSIIFFNSVRHMSELPRFKDLEFKYYETETDLESAGILHESPTLREDSFNNYRAEINRILNLTKEEREQREIELAIDGYNKLRPAIEVFVEKEMFKETVKRYRKNVALTSLEKVNGGLIDKHKVRLYDIFEKCCEYIEAHSSPDGLQAKPTLTELKMDFDEVCQIRNNFVN